MSYNNQDKQTTRSRTSKRGFASMDPEKQRQIASKGGRAVSENRNHMVQIGKKGGEASGESRRKDDTIASAEQNNIG
jgi:general stress protein YciG